MTSAPPPSSPVGSKPAPSRYSMGSAANMVRSMLVIGAILVVAILALPQRKAAPPAAIDVTVAAQQVLESAGLPVSAPVGLPSGWSALRAQYQRSADGLMTWHVGYQTDSGSYAGYEQARDVTQAWVDRAIHRGNRTGTLTVAGESWDRYETEDGKQRTIVRAGGPGQITTAVTGTGDDAELTVLAGALAPVAIP